MKSFARAMLVVAWLGRCSGWPRMSRWEEHVSKWLQEGQCSTEFDTAGRYGEFAIVSWKTGWLSASTTSLNGWYLSLKPIVS